MQPRVQRDLFARCYREDRLRGQGYAWLSFWSDDKVFINPDGSDNSDAALGAEASQLLGGRTVGEPVG